MVQSEQNIVGRKNGKKKKEAKGTVKLESDKGWLRLRFTHTGKRRAFALGLPDTNINRKFAEQKARQIELDIISGNFDPTLKKYRPQKTKKKIEADLITAEELILRFIEHKSQFLSSRSLEKYQTILTHLISFNLKGKTVVYSLALRSVVELEQDCSDQFYQYLSRKLAPITLKQSIVCLSACWQWGIEQEIIKFDPWKPLLKRIKVPPKQMPKPFTKGEIQAIIQGFKQDRYYSYYFEFVEFLFGTGCRTGEAIGLCWKHLNEDCSTVWIGESLSRGIRKATKTNRARTITLTSRLQSLLLSMKSKNFDLERPVFTTRKGNLIDDHNFRNRAWKSILAKVGVEYRKPYNTRHTLISHALDQGMNPVAVAQLTGHDVQTLYENYAGNVNSRPKLPKLFE
jgi:integrase